jgi:hypothetical protein
MRERPFTLRASSPPEPSSRGVSEDDVRALIDAFDRRLDAELVRDVAASCDRVERALEHLHAMAPAPSPRVVAPAHPQVFGGTIPDDVRDVIFRSLSARDAGALACTCREFRALVTTWRADARRLVFPRPTTSTSTTGRGRDGANQHRVLSSHVGAMTRAYPYVEEVSFRKLGETLAPSADEDEDVAARRLASALVAVSANNPSHTVRSIDFDGCGEWLSEHAVVELTELCVEAFPSLSAVAWPRARALTGRGASRALASCGSTLRELTLAGCASLTEEDVKTALDLARGLRALDVTGCWGVRRLVLAAVDAPRLETLKAVNCKSMTTLSIRRAAGSRALKRVNCAECVALREFLVQSESVESLNAAGCRALETFVAYAPACETLALNKCASLRDVTTEAHTVRTTLSAVRALTLDGCKQLTTSGFERLLDACAATLTRLSAEGCFAVERARVVSPRLEHCALSGCSALQVVRISGADCRAFVARACRALAEVRFESGTRALDVFDARNSSALRRVVGVDERRARVANVEGCAPSVEFIARA